ncbi:MAG: hypothetical protein P4N41_18055 [Negativicutes bacterium]|nr:hypothetical protein [Negativicutes bacterium]
MNLKRATFKHIEAELFNFHQTVKALEEARNEIILAGKNLELGMVSGESFDNSITERRATKLADSLLLREMDRITKAVRDTYEMAKEDCRRVLWIKYRLMIGWRPNEELLYVVANKHQDLTAKEMAEILHMDDSTYHRYRNGFIYGVAERLGWY